MIHGMNNRIVSAIRAQNLSLSSLKRSLFIREFLLFASSTVLYQGSRFVVSLGAAKILGPLTYGLWNLLNLILIYRGVIHMGVIPAMNRDVPLFKGKSDLGKVDEIRRISLGFTLFSGFVSSAVMLAVAMLIEDLTFRIYFQSMALLLLCTQIYHYLQVYLKSDRRFNQMSYQQFAFAGVLPLIAIPLAVRYKLSGYIIGQSITIFIVSLFIVRIIPFDLKPKFNLQETIRLVKVGFPIMAAALLYGFLTTTDRWIITGFLGVEQLGYYSLAIIVTGSLSLIPRVIAEQVYPRMAEEYGKTSTYYSLRRWILRQIAMAVAATLPLILGVYFLFPPLVRTFLPDYVAGIAAMRIILIGLLFLPIAGACSNFLNTVDKQVYYMIVQGFAVPVNLGLNVIFVKMGLGINGVALGTATTYVIYTLTLAVIVHRILAKAE